MNSNTFSTTVKQPFKRKNTTVEALSSISAVLTLKELTKIKI